MKLLLESSADTETAGSGLYDDPGWTPMMRAAGCERYDVVRFMVEG